MEHIYAMGLGLVGFGLLVLFTWLIAGLGWRLILVTVVIAAVYAIGRILLLLIFGIE